MNIERQLFDMPDSVALLPRDERGYPIPAFVETVNGKPDFRVIRMDFRIRCVKENLCWICGGKMGRKKWFCLGPMCTITRTTSEPPTHKLCAEFAAKNCPFLTRPMAKRNERGLEEVDTQSVGGVQLDRNPGAVAIWETETYKPFNVPDGWLITVGPPKSMTIWREGRAAHPEEFLESIRTGLPALMELAKQEGPIAMLEFQQTLDRYKAEIIDRFLYNGGSHGNA